MAVDLADEVRKRKVIDDLGMESSFDYDPIAEDDSGTQSTQNAPQQNFVLTPVEGMESPIPDFESVEDQPPEQAATFLNPATGSIERLQSLPPSQGMPYAAPNVALASREIQPAAPRAELVKLPPVPSVAAASRELDLAPAAEPVQRVERGQLVGLPPEQLPDDYTGDEEAAPETVSDTGIPDDYAGLDVATPTQAPTAAAQPPVPQPSTQNYVLAPVDATTGQVLPQPAQPAQPATTAKTTEPATAPQTIEPDLTEPARPGSYTPYQGNEPRRIQGIILHSSDGSLRSDINTLTGGDPSHKVSAHYYTAADGTVHHFVADNDIAYHAGATTGQYGYLNNGNTIGIEQEHVDGTPWKDAEVRGTAKIVADLLRRYPYLSINDVLGHSDIAPERKQDPLNFPWDRFRSYVAQDLKQQGAVSAAPIAQPGNKLPNGFYQNEDPKSFISGRATTFATPEDIASGQDPGVGSPKLGKLDTTRVAGVAVPLDVLQSQLGSNPAVWRKARVDVVDQETGKRLRLPIVDVGPSNPNALFDMTPWVSNYFGGDKTLSVKLVPNAGPDVVKNPGSWGDEQAAIRQGFDSSALVPGAVKVQKPQNYVLAPVAPPSAEALAADAANQKKQIGILTQLPEAQGQSLPDLINRLDQPVDGVNDALRKAYQDQVKQQATKFAQETYGIKDPAEAYQRIMQPAGALDYASQVFKSAAGHMLSMVSSFNANMASKDEDNAVKVLKLVNPDASPEQISETMKHLTNPDLSHADRERLIRDAVMVPYSQLDQAHQSTFDLAGAVESIRRLADPQYVAERQKVLDQQVNSVNALLKPDPRLNPMAAHVIDVVSQLPAMGVQLATGPIGGSLMLSDIYKGTLDKLKAEHPEMSDAQRQDMAGRNALVQAGIMYASAGTGRLFEGMIGDINNAVTRGAVRVGTHIGAGSATMVAARAAENLLTAHPLTEGLGEAAITGGGLGAIGAVTGGELARPDRAQPEPRPQPVLPSQVLGPEVSEPEIIPGYSVFQNIPRPPPVTARQILGPEVSTQENVPWYRQRNPLVSRLAEGVWTPESVARAVAGLPAKATPEELARRAFLLQPSPGSLREVHLAPEAGAELVPQPTLSPVQRIAASPFVAAQAGVPPVDPRFVTRSSDNTIINVPADEVDQRWNSSSLNKNFYLAPGGEGPNYIGNRYQAAQDYLGGNKPMYAPEVTVASDGSMHFIDGRHTFAAMRDNGMEHVPVAMDAESLKNLQETRIAGIPELQAPVQGEAEPWVSKIANRFSTERVAAGEIGPVEPGKGVSTESMLAKGLKMGPEEINQHVSDLMQGKGDPVAQAAAVRSEEARLSQRSNAASRAAEADPTNQILRTQANEAFNDLTDFHNGPVAKLKNNWHAQGMTLQGEMPVDLSTYNGMREAFLKEVGKAPSPDIEPTLRKTAKRVRDAAEADLAAMNKLGAEIERQTAKRKLASAEETRAKGLSKMGVEMPCPM